MAPELSSNWKKLQAKIKAESSSASTAAAAAPSSSSSTKRKAAEEPPAAATAAREKKRKVREPSRKPAAPPAKPATAGKRAGATGAPKPMGVTQSSAVAKGSAATVTPSLALWAADNDISPEDLAEAYGLGLRRNGRAAAAAQAAEPERVNEGRAPGVDVGKYVALDCEMVGVGPDGRDSVLARASLVDFHGRQVYDSFVRPRERVTDWRTGITGIGPRQMAAARDFAEVQADVADLLRGRILVGHDLKHDLAVLALAHPATHVRDTVRFAGFRQYGHGPKPALRVLAKEILDLDIQSGHHSSVEDARVAMLLFRKKKSEFDMEHANKYDKAAAASKARPQQPKKKKKKH